LSSPLPRRRRWATLTAFIDESAKLIYGLTFALATIDAKGHSPQVTAGNMWP